MERPNRGAGQQWHLSPVQPFVQRRFIGQPSIDHAWDREACRRALGLDLQATAVREMRRKPCSVGVSKRYLGQPSVLDLGGRQNLDGFVTGWAIRIVPEWRVPWWQPGTSVPQWLVLHDQPSHHDSVDVEGTWTAVDGVCADRASAHAQHHAVPHRRPLSVDRRCWQLAHHQPCLRQLVRACVKGGREGVGFWLLH